MRTNRLQEITFEKDARSVHLPYMCLQTAKYHAVIYGSCINNSKAYIRTRREPKKLTSIGVRSSRILSAEFTHSLTSKFSSENLEKSISFGQNKAKYKRKQQCQLTTHLPPF